MLKPAIRVGNRRLMAALDVGCVGCVGCAHTRGRTGTRTH